MILIPKTVVPGKPKLLMVSSFPTTIEGNMSLFARQTEFPLTVVGGATTLEDALKLLTTHKPDIIHITVNYLDNDPMQPLEFLEMVKTSTLYSYCKVLVDTYEPNIFEQVQAKTPNADAWLVDSRDQTELIEKLTKLAASTDTKLEPED